MMNENSSSQHDQARKALQAGNKKSAAQLLHQLLKQDITDQTAWALLHQALAAQVPFKEFQTSFAQKYYPDQAFLLTFSQTEESSSPFLDTPPAAKAQDPFTNDTRSPFSAPDAIPPAFGPDPDAAFPSNSPFNGPTPTSEALYTGPMDPPPAMNEPSKEEWEIDKNEPAPVPGATFSPRSKKKERSRGGCLTAYLILSIISGVTGILATLFVLAMLPWFKEQIVLAAKEAPQLLVLNQFSSAIFIGILAYAILQLVVFIGIWQWKSWALYSFVGLALVGFFFQIIYSDLTSAFCGLTSPVLLFILAFRQWDDFD